MRISNGGITIEGDIPDGSGELHLTVLEQSSDFTDMLKASGKLTHKSGISIRSNNHPSFNHKESCFYVRGQDESKNDKQVVAKFDTEEDAWSAWSAIGELIGRMRPMVPIPGGTTSCRQAIITKSQASKLGMTAHKWYPGQRQWKPCAPIVTDNPHYNEHIGQLVDVLNKAAGQAAGDAHHQNVVNPHKVSPADAKFALDIVRNAFDRAEAQGEGALVATWRIISGLRGPDFEDPRQPQQPNRNEQ